MLTHVRTFARKCRSLGYSLRRNSSNIEIGGESDGIPLPNYVHVGQGKAGSTTLHHMLVQHSSVCLVKSKEAHFFSNDDNYAKGLDVYRSQHFEHYNNETIIGDITPAYFSANALERIHADLDAQALLLSVGLRFPVARTTSHYFHDVRLLQQRNSLRGTLQHDAEYVVPSRGSEILSNLWRLFPKENVLPLIFERDFSGNGAHVAYEKVCNFLGLNPETIGENEKRAVGFIPKISIAEIDGSVDDYRGKQQFKKGDIIIETLQWTTHYKAEIISSPDDETRDEYATFFDNVTMHVSNEEIRDIYAEFFEADVESLKEALKDPLPEWTLDGKEVKAPPSLESRVEASAKVFALGN